MNSNLSAFPFIANGSEATPELWNRIFSTLSSNIAAIDSNATINLSGATLSIGSSVSIGQDLWVQGRELIGPAPSTTTNRTALLSLVGDMSNAGSGGTDYIYFNDSSGGKTSWLIGSGVGDATDSLTFFNLSQGTPVIKLLPTSIQVGGGTPTPGALSINQKNNQAGVVINQGSDPGSYAMLIQNGVFIGDVRSAMVYWIGQWASSATSQIAFRINMTNTASHISSRLISLEVDGSDRFTVGVDGTLRSQGTNPYWRFTQGTFNTDGVLDPSMYVAPPNKANPAIDSEALYVQHRVSNNIGGSQVHDAVAAELRLSAVTNTNSAFLNALETSVVFAGGGSLVSDSRSLTANLVVDSGVTGTVGNYAMIRSQSGPTLPGGFSIGTLASLWLEQQTVGTNNYTLYGPDGISRVGTLQVVGTGARGRLYLDGTGGADTSILGFSLSSVTQFQIQHDNTNQKLYIIASGGTGIAIDAAGVLLVAGKVGTSSGNTVSHGTWNLLAANTFVDGAGNYFAITAPAGNARDWRVFSGAAGSASTLRWLMRFDGTTESGSNAGTDFTMLARDDSGGAIGTALKITRSNMQAAFGSSVSATAFVANPGSALAPTFNIVSESSLGLYRSGVSTIALSYGTFNLATNSVRLSMRTLAASSVTASAANTNVAVNEVVFTIQGSGASFVINSGGTTWIFNSDASAKNT